MQRRFGKWTVIDGRLVPIFAGGSTDDSTDDNNQQNENSEPSSLKDQKETKDQDKDNSLYKIQQEYERTLKFLQEKFGVSSIEELNLKIKAEEEQKLKEQQKFKELAEKKEKEALEYRQKWQQTILKAEVVGKASQMGFIDPEVVLSLISPQAIVREDGNIEINGKSIDDYLKELAENKPYLIKGSGKQGSGATPAVQNTVYSDIKSYEDLLKSGSKAMKEFMDKYPDKYQQLKEEYFAKKVGG